MLPSFILRLSNNKNNLTIQNVKRNNMKAKNEAALLKICLRMRSNKSNWLKFKIKFNTKMNRSWKNNIQAAMASVAFSAAKFLPATLIESAAPLLYCSQRLQEFCPSKRWRLEAGNIHSNANTQCSQRIFAAAFVTHFKLIWYVVIFGILMHTLRPNLHFVVA